MTVPQEDTVDSPLVPSHRLSSLSTSDSSVQNGDAAGGIINSMRYVETISISKGSRHRLSNAMHSLESPYTNFESHCHNSFNAVMSFLPPDAIATIKAFHSNPEGPGALHIRGLPTDDTLPSTPAKGSRADDKSSFVSEGCLTGIASIIGDVFGYATEKDGELIHNVCPVKGGETTQSNESSKVNLDIHIENAYFDERPDYLALYCLRQDHEKKARTYLADVRVALQRLSPETITELRRAAFVVPSPESHHKAQGRVQWSLPRPIIQGRLSNCPTMLFRFPGLKAIDERAEAVLREFAKVINDPEVIYSISLQPGELLLLNNSKVAHGRTYFEARYDGMDRWLQRVYIRGDKPSRLPVRIDTGESDTSQ